MLRFWADRPGQGIAIRVRSVFAGIASLWVLGAAPAFADTQPPPNYGFNFATVDHPGNASTQTFPRPGAPTYTLGGVDHTYRIATTETTNGQWFNFVQAYAPFVDPRAWQDPSFIGHGIAFGGASGGLPHYSLIEPYAERPAEVGWHMAARFCNWSHNGQKGIGQASAADFDNGAYDMSRWQTPGWDSAHSADARFWIPTMDEWVKAAYWDPNKNGPGQPGYWSFPITSDTAPIPGDPALGGQTNAGPFPPGQIRPLDVGSYPTVMSPWGLLDCSGGLEEWTQNPYLDLGSHRIIGSNSYYQFDPALADLLVRTYGNGDGTDHVGFRIASTVPGPMAAPVLFGLASLLTTRTRRTRPCANCSFPP